MSEADAHRTRRREPVDVVGRLNFNERSHLLQRMEETSNLDTKQVSQLIVENSFCTHYYMLV